MSKIIEKVKSSKVYRKISYFFKLIKIPGLNGLSLYELTKIYIEGIINGTLTARAGSISFSFFMALFPFLLFILNLIPFIPINDLDSVVFNFIELLLPKETHLFFSDIFLDIQSQQRRGLLSSVFILSIFLTANGVNSIFVSFEESYNVELTRNFFKQYLLSVGVSVVLAFLSLLTVIMFFYFEFYILNNLGSLIPSEIRWTRIGQFTFFGLFVYLTVNILYYFGTIEGRKNQFFTIGALMTTLLFFLTTYGFGIYIEISLIIISYMDL
jgi:membrane protein